MEFEDFIKNFPILYYRMRVEKMRPDMDLNFEITKRLYVANVALCAWVDQM